MTLGTWICTECKYTIEEIHISSVVLECPKCKIKDKKVKTIKPHVEHKITITKSSNGKKNAIIPIFFAFNEDNIDDVKEYFAVIESISPLSTENPPYIT